MMVSDKFAQSGKLGQPAQKKLATDAMQLYVFFLESMQCDLFFTCNGAHVMQQRSYENIGDLFAREAQTLGELPRNVGRSQLMHRYVRIGQVNGVR
jgi:hypothetical protein